MYKYKEGVVTKWQLIAWPTSKMKEDKLQQWWEENKRLYYTPYVGVYEGN